MTPRLITALHALRGRSARELATRAAQAAAAFAERRHWGPDVHEPSERCVLRWAGAATSAELLLRFRESGPARFFTGLRTPADTLAALDRTCPGAVTAAVARAQSVRRGRLALLGHRELVVGMTPDWCRDPVSGRRAPRVHWSRIAYLDPATVGDHKAVWELNRHQYFLSLGQAYCVTGDESYAQAWARHVTSWLDDNPPAIGINWASSLEVAFRAMSWVWALHFFRESPALTPRLFARILGSLHLHGRHVARFLSTYFSPNTHLTGEALGLLVLGSALPELPDAPAWRRLGWEILEAQLELQVSDDGVYFEQASYYQRYTADFYLHALALEAAQGLPRRPHVERRLHQLLTHLAYLTRPDGTLPLIGDDDGGRLAPIDGRAPDDCRPALSTGAVVLDDASLASSASAVAEETVWLLGPDAVSAFARLRDKGTALPPSRAFALGGYCVMRDRWAADASHAVIDCGPHGALRCGHSHADALSVDLSVRGTPVLVDAGTYTYTASREDRDYFRGATAHNTLTIDDLPPSVPAGPFAWERGARASLLRWESAPEFDFAGVTHDGYDRVPGIGSVTRELLFLKGGYWVLRDRVAAHGTHRVQVHFHAAPGLGVAAETATRFVLSRPDGPVLGVAASGGGRANLAVHLGRGWTSRAYGAREATHHAIVESVADGAHDITTLLLPDALARTTVITCEDGDTRVIEVMTGAYCDALLLRAAPRDGGEPGEHHDGVASDAEWTWVRRTALDGAVESFVVVGGSRLVVDGVTLVDAESRATFVSGSRTGGAWTVSARAAGRLTLGLSGPVQVMRRAADAILTRPAPRRRSGGDLPSLMRAAR